MKNKSLSIRLAAVLSAAMLGAGLAAGCGNGNVTAPEDTEIDPFDDSEDGADTDIVDDDTVDDGAGSGAAPTVDENDPNFNHGYSISELGTERMPNEITRSKDVVIHDSTEALEYLESCVPLMVPDSHTSLRILRMMIPVLLCGMKSVYHMMARSLKIRNLLSWHLTTEP